ncbi:MAG: hypothetical protein MJE77_20930 [Proteobacteria bacterium]|nr:hypothetical protein [Pseudomonadota bacterium]
MSLLPVGRIVRRTMSERVPVRVFVVALLAYLVANLSGCAPTRTAAATQTTPAAFDPSTSDAKAIGVIDEMVAALGSAAAWSQVKQLRWELKYFQNDELMGWVRHSWDIWNGRHRYEFIGSATLQQFKASDGKEPPIFTIAMYDLYDHQGKGYVTDSARINTPANQAYSEDRDRIVEEAFRAWQRDSYQLTMFHKLKDPGVKLEYVGEREDIKGKCKPACLDIKVSFVPEVGSDLYHVYISPETKLPEVVERVQSEGSSLAFILDNWTEVNGLKFPQVFKNLGPNEEFRIENIHIGDPEQELYVPTIR